MFQVSLPKSYECTASCCLYRQTQRNIPMKTLDTNSSIRFGYKKGKRKVQGVPQSQTAALPRHQVEEEKDKTKQTQIKHSYEKH